MQVSWVDVRWDGFLRIHSELWTLTGPPTLQHYLFFFFHECPVWQPIRGSETSTHDVFSSSYPTGPMDRPMSLLNPGMGLCCGMTALFHCRSLFPRTESEEATCRVSTSFQEDAIGWSETPSLCASNGGFCLISYTRCLGDWSLSSISNLPRELPNR